MSKSVLPVSPLVLSYFTIMCLSCIYFTILQLIQFSILRHTKVGEILVTNLCHRLNQTLKGIAK